MTKQPKQKTCKACRNKFTPVKPLQSCCDWKCALDHATALRLKREASESRLKRAEHKAAKERIKSRADWIKDAQQAVNAYIRARDYGKPCISCGRATKSGDHAGHWKPTSSSPELRFHEDNIHLQCVQCNLHLHGNVVNYRTGLLGRIGRERVESLEGKHEPCKWTIEELKQIKSKYSKLARELK